jgi:hypothetical protein
METYWGDRHRSTRGIGVTHWEIRQSSQGVVQMTEQQPKHYIITEDQIVEIQERMDGGAFYKARTILRECRSRPVSHSDFHPEPAPPSCGTCIRQSCLFRDKCDGKNCLFYKMPAPANPKVWWCPYQHVNCTEGGDIHCDWPCERWFVWHDTAIEQAARKDERERIHELLKHQPDEDCIGEMNSDDCLKYEGNCTLCKFDHILVIIDNGKKP